MRCEDIQSIYTAYCTTFPCVTCQKMLLTTSCERIVFTNNYSHPTLWNRQSRRM